MIIDIIAKESGLNADFLNKIAISASHRYKKYNIKKANGEWRGIYHPSVELKFLQRWLVENIFNRLPVHNSVYSYKKGKNVRHLAEIHKTNNFILRIDFSDFFPSIHAEDIKELLLRNNRILNLGLSEFDITVIKSIVCRYDSLVIGAPSSPSISNAILYDFDELCFQKAKKEKVIYSRYADDVYYSTNKPFVLEKILKDFKSDLAKLRSPKLNINHDKTIFTSRKRKRMITGLVLTSDKKISVGRSKKRYIKSLIYKYKSETIEKQELDYLQGYLAYLLSVEPEYLNNLKVKFSESIINNILRKSDG